MDNIVMNYLNNICNIMIFDCMQITHKLLLESLSRCAFLCPYFFIVILWGEEVINNGHRLSKLLTQCIQKAICVL